MAAKAYHRKKQSEDHEEEGNGHEKGIWSGNISFGLVNIGVRLVSAKEQKSLSFSMLDPTNLSPVGYKYYNKRTGEEVKRGSTVKGYEYKPGSYVLMGEGDFRKANPKATQSIDIEGFVKLEEIDPVFFERAYYLLPIKGSEKAYKLFREALGRSRRVAIAKVVLHTKQHLVALMPRGDYLLCELLHFAEDVKELRELDKKNNQWKKALRPGAASSREVQMAERLIDDMTVPWKPDAYKDTYRADLMRQVKAKVKAGKATEIDEDAAEKPEGSSKVLDLMPLLRKSLEGKRSQGKRNQRKRSAG